MVKFHSLFTSFMLIGLVILSLFAFGIAFQSENKIENQFIEDSLMSNTYANLTQDLESLKDESQAQKTLFESENPTGGFGTILLFSIVSTGKVFNGMVMGVFNTIILLPTRIGVNPVIISVMSALLILSIIIGLWKLYKLGG